MVSSDGGEWIEALVDRNVHAAFVGGKVCHPDLQYIHLFREEFAAVVSARHRLARLGISRFEALGEENVVWLRREADPLICDSMMALWSAQGVRPRITDRVSTLTECLEFARAGLGITFLPCSFQPRDESVCFIPLPAGVLYADYGLACARQHASPELDCLIRLARHHALQKNTTMQVRPLINRSA